LARWGESARALVVLRSGAHVVADQTIAHARSEIAHSKAPKTVMFVHELARLPNGKINKIALREEDVQGSSK